MKIKNIVKSILSAAVCAVFLTACGSEKSAEKSSEKASTAESASVQTESHSDKTTAENTTAETNGEQTAPTEVNTEEIDIKVPENAAYRQTELKYIQGKLSTICFNFFDEHDNCIYLFSQPTEDSNEEWATTFDCSYSYKYNADDTIAEMSIVDSDDIQTMEYEYNEDKTVRTETGYRNGKLWFTTVCTYDDHSNPVRTEMTFVNANKSYISTYEYEYDPDGRILVEKCTKDNDLSNYTKRNTYDENGNTASLETTYAHSDSPQLTKYTYNSENRLIKEENFTDGEESEYTEYEYEFYN